MSERFFGQIDRARARAAADEARGVAPAPAAPPSPPLSRWLGRLLIGWILLLLVLALGGEERLIATLALFTPIVALPATLLRIAGYAGLLPERLVGGRPTGEAALMSGLFWVVMALVAWVDTLLGGIASLLLLALLFRRVNAIALHGMYLAERARIRSGRGPSEPISESPARLDGRPSGTEIASRQPNREEKP